MISVFTPTYNRAYILPVLYQSLRRQTCHDFEWVIVDDGSTDNTEEIVCSWLKENNDFPIVYRRQQNGGKHTAINNGVSLAQGEWFFIVDSDDYIVDDAIEKICIWTKEQLPNEIAAVAGTKCFKDSSTIGGSVKFKGEYCDCKNTERRKYGLLGDKAEVYRTDILKKYPFPVFEGEKFLSECAVWDRIALDGYKIRWYDEPLMVCEYLNDGLTAKVTGADLELKNFKGLTYVARQRMKAYKGIERCQYLSGYIKKARIVGMSIQEISETLNIKVSSVLLVNFISGVRAKKKKKKVLKSVGK